MEHNWKWKSIQDDSIAYLSGCLSRLALFLACPSSRLFLQTVNAVLFKIQIFFIAASLELSSSILHSNHRNFLISVIVSDPSVTQNNGFFEGSPSNSINFRDLEIGKSETRVIYLKNNSLKESYYCVVAEEGGVFQIASKQGIIPPMCDGLPIRCVNDGL